MFDLSGKILFAIVVVLLIVYLSMGFWKPIEGMKRSFQTAAGFLPEYLWKLPKGSTSVGKEGLAASNLDGLPKTESEIASGDPRSNNSSLVGQVEVETNNYVSNESEDGKIIQDPNDWENAIQEIGLDPSVTQSHKKYVHDEYRYLNRGSAQPNFPINENTQTINGFVGLFPTLGHEGLVGDGARVVPSENYSQLRPGTQGRWKSSWSDKPYHEHF